MHAQHKLVSAEHRAHALGAQGTQSCRELLAGRCQLAAVGCICDMMNEGADGLGVAGARLCVPRPAGMQPRT
jgi:hypothetical protein